MGGIFPDIQNLFSNIEYTGKDPFCTFDDLAACDSGSDHRSADPPCSPASPAESGQYGQCNLIP